MIKIKGQHSVVFKDIHLMVRGVAATAANQYKHISNYFFAACTGAVQEPYTAASINSPFISGIKPSVFTHLSTHPFSFSHTHTHMLAVSKDKTYF